MPEADDHRHHRPPGPVGDMADAFRDAIKLEKEWKFDAEAIGLFWPNYGKEYGRGAIVQSGKNTIFRDHHLFIQRAKDYLLVEGEQRMRDNLYLCFRGEALEWYTVELIDDSKELVKTGAGIDQWERKLISRFRRQPAQALRALTTTKYTMEDARLHRSPRVYAQAIIRDAKDVGIVDPMNQLLYVRQGIDAELHRDLPYPDANSEVDKFLQIIDQVAETWYSLASPPVAKATNYNRQGGQYTQGRSRNFDGGARQPKSSNSGGREPFAYNDQNKQRSWGNVNDQKRNPIFPRGGNTWGKPPQGGRSFGRETQGKQGPKQYGDRSSEKPPSYGKGGYYGDQDDDDMYYGDENQIDEPLRQGEQCHAYDEQANESENDAHQGELVEHSGDEFTSHHAQYTCSTCPSTEKQAFPSSNKLYEHLESLHGYPRHHEHDGIDSRTISADSMAKIPSVKSSNKVTDFQKRAVFRSYMFATMHVSLQAGQSTTEVCVDTGCGISLIDRAFLFKNVPKAKILTAEHPKQLRGIGGDALRLEEYVRVSIYVPGMNDKGQRVKAHITAELHLVDNLKANMLIANDVIVPEQFVIRASCEQVVIGSCNVIAPLKLKGPPPVTRKVKSAESLTIPAHTCQMIEVHYGDQIPDDRDYIFMPGKHDIDLGPGGGACLLTLQTLSSTQSR